MISSQSIEGQIERIKMLAQTLNTFVIFAPVVGGESGTTIRVFLDEPEFLRAVEHIKPSIIYLDVQRFEVKQGVEDHSERCRDEDGDDDFENFQRPFVDAPQYKALIKKWSSHDSTVVRLVTVFFVGMVRFTLSEMSDWVDVFEEEVERGFADYTEGERERAGTARLARREEVREKARVLSEHPLFGAPRSSKAKREYLAQQVFPTVRFSDLADIIELADLLFWYRGSKVSPKS